VTSLTKQLPAHVKSTSTRRAPFRSRAYLKFSDGTTFRVVNEPSTAQPGSSSNSARCCPRPTSSSGQAEQKVGSGYNANSHRFRLHHSPSTAALTQDPELRHQPGWLLGCTTPPESFASGGACSRTRIQIFGQRRPFCPGSPAGWRPQILVLLYTYSGEQQIAQPWIPRVHADLRCAANAFAGCAWGDFNCGADSNLYRDGDDTDGWHADDEPELDPGAPIASLSLGATRSFRFNPKGEAGQP